MSVSTVKLNGTTLMTVNDTTATAGDVLGKYFYAADGTKTLGTAASQSGSSDGDVIFIDYDGTVVAAKTKAEINAMTSDSDLPANPTHTGLVAQGWNWTVAQLKAQLLAMPEQKVYVGQMYTTVSGATEIDVEIIDGRTDPKIYIACEGTISIDWGDNTTPDSLTGPSISTQLEIQHTYTNPGNYTIKITLTSGTQYAFFGTSNRSIIWGSTGGDRGRVYSSSVRAIRIGKDVSKIKDYGLYYLTNMQYITIPKEITSIGQYALGNCYSLNTIIIPKDVTTLDYRGYYYNYNLENIIMPPSITVIEQYAFYYCYTLKRLTIPKDTSTINSSAFAYSHGICSMSWPPAATRLDSSFSYCANVKHVYLPNTITDISSNAFNNCKAIAKLTIPNSVERISSVAFKNCYGMKEYHFQRTTPATLYDSNAFDGITSDCIIYVPYSADHSILAAYQSETNWATYASYMVEEPAP